MRTLPFPNSRRAEGEGSTRSQFLSLTRPDFPIALHKPKKQLFSVQESRFRTRETTSEARLDDAMYALRVLRRTF